MEFLPTTLIAIGTVIAALIAGIFSFFNLVSTKESKISEFRQKWIDDLRNDISIYVTRMDMVFGFTNEAHKNKERLSYEEIERLKEKSIAAFIEAKVAYVAIKLRINKEEKNKKKKLINNSFMNALEKSYRNYDKDDASSHNAELNEVVVSASGLLKMEWNRVRDGESGYKWSKRAAIAFIIASSLTAGWLLIHNHPYRAQVSNVSKEKTKTLEETKALTSIPKK